MESMWQEYVIVGFATVITAAVVAISSDEPLGGAVGGGLYGFIGSALFCTAVRLLIMPQKRQLEVLQARIAQLEQRAEEPKPTA